MGREPFLHRFGPTVRGAFDVRINGAMPEEDPEMLQLLQRYLQYRRVGFGRVAAFHFAWLVVNSPSKPVSTRRAISP